MITVKGRLNGETHMITTNDEIALEKFADAMDTIEYIR